MKIIFYLNYDISLYKQDNLSLITKILKCKNTYAVRQKWEMREISNNKH